MNKMLLVTVIAVYSPTNYAPSDTLEGYFNGDGKKELAWVKLVKESSGNPADGGIPAEYAILFSDTALPAIKIDCCDAYLVREGDLNNDGKDDLSTFQAPLNGCTYYMRTWTLKDDKWENVLEPFMLPTGGMDFSRADLENTIFLKEGKLYFTDIDVNDDFKKVIKPVRN